MELFCDFRFSSTIFSSAPESDICFRPFDSMISSASAADEDFASHIALNTSFAILLEIVPSAIRPASDWSCCGEMRDAVMSRFSSLSRADSGPVIRFARSEGFTAPDAPAMAAAAAMIGLTHFLFLAAILSIPAILAFMKSRSAKTSEVEMAPLEKLVAPQKEQLSRQDFTVDGHAHGRIFSSRDFFGGT